MPRQNRVTPLGDLVAVPERGLVYGNRGCLHDAEGRIRRPFQVKRWIACRLEFRGRHRADPMPPGRYTGLFFLDEATAFAAGHRPCAECRREDYNRYLEIVGERRADDVDERLHAERSARTIRGRWSELPDGAFVLRDGEPLLVLGDRAAALDARRATPSAVRVRAGRDGDHARNTVRVLAGWNGDVPFLHVSGR